MAVAIRLFSVRIYVMTPWMMPSGLTWVQQQIEVECFSDYWHHSAFGLVVTASVLLSYIDEVKWTSVSQWLLPNRLTGFTQNHGDSSAVTQWPYQIHTDFNIMVPVWRFVTHDHWPCWLHTDFSVTVTAWLLLMDFNGLTNSNVMVRALLLLSDLIGFTQTSMSLWQLYCYSVALLYSRLQRHGDSLVVTHWPYWIHTDFNLIVTALLLLSDLAECTQTSTSWWQLGCYSVTMLDSHRLQGNGDSLVVAQWSTWLLLMVSDLNGLTHTSVSRWQHCRCLVALLDSYKLQCNRESLDVTL